MQWSMYQTNIYEAFENTSDSLLIEAVAGSGKTTVLVELARIMRERMPTLRGCFMAFNKSIATTLQEKIGQGGNVVAMTLHSAGWAAWRRAGGLDWTPRVDEHKVSRIIREMCNWEERKKFEESTRKLVGYAKGIGLVPGDCDMGVEIGGMRMQGLADDDQETWDGLIEHYGLDEAECNIPLVRKVLAKSIEQARDGCDWDDMLYMPIVAGVAFDRYDVVLVDEAQDVSGIQMEMIARMVKADDDVRRNIIGTGGRVLFTAEEQERPWCDFVGGRVIAVGDRHQACYGFRGAGTDSMDLLRARFDMKELPLSVSYRCPISVVQHARQWVPQVEWREDAPDGVVFGEGTEWSGQSEIALGNLMWVPWKLAPDSDPAERYILVLAADDREEHPGGRLFETEAEAQVAAAVDGITKWRGISDFQPGDAILCRLTRPLIEAAFAIIRKRIACRVLGRDIGAGLVSLVKKPKFDAARPVSDWEAWAGVWSAQQRERLSQKRQWAAIGNLEDRLATVFCFIDELHDQVAIQGGSMEPTIGELISSIESVFKDRGPEGLVTLSTCHKAKGMEWPRVFILDARKFMPVPWGRQGGWERQQEDNIAYVAATRSSRELRYISSEALGIERRR